MKPAEIGARWSEINTILRRIRKRPSGEPTAKERERLKVLRTEIRQMEGKE